MPFVHREIALNNGPPWGFRLYEDMQKGLIIHRVRQFSPADEARLKEGDVLLEINGYTTKRMNHHAAVDIIDSTYNTLLLLVGRFETSTNRRVMFLDQRGAMQPNAVTKVQFNLHRPPPEPMTTPASPGLVPLPLSRLMAQHDFPPRPESIINRKRFANSEFFDTGDVHYPTVEEKIEMAKQLSESLTAPVNMRSKGAIIFEKQRTRIDKYVKEGPDPEPEEDVLQIVLPDGTIQDVDPPDIEPPPPPSHPPVCFPGDPPVDRIGVPPPPPLPKGAPKTLKEYLETIKRHPRVQHDAIGPEKCFNIASSLHKGEDRGGMIFLRNRDRSVKWTITDENVKSFHSDIPDLHGSRQHQQHEQQQYGVPSKLRNQGASSTRTTRTVETTSNKNGTVQTTKISQTTINTNNPNYSNNQNNNMATDSSKWRPVKFTIPSHA